MKLSPTGLIIAVAPGVGMLAVFYSLAFHMHQTLGGWPKDIGELGFPAHLLLHANINMDCFMVLFLFTIFVLPVAFTICFLVPRLRPLLAYLCVCFFSCIIAVGLMQLAPAPFLYWWWD